MKNLLLALIISVPFIASAQSDSTKTTRYCDVKVEASLFKKKLQVAIDFGSSADASDIKLKTDEALKNFTNEPDILNYLAKHGWRLVSSIIVGNPGAQDHFFMKKEY